jgi:Xaa-Pro aminopeptidase
VTTTAPLADSPAVARAEALASRRRRLGRAMAADGLDALLVVGAGVLKQHGYLDWVVGAAPLARAAHALLLPDGTVRVAVATPADAELVRARGAGADPVEATPGTPLTTVTVQLLRAAGARRVGIVARDTLLPLAAFRMLERTLPGAEFVEAAPLANRLKAVKDGFEVGELAHAARMADAAYERLCEHVRPGVTDAELAADAHAEARRQGARESLVFVGAGLHHGFAPRRIPLESPALVTVYIELCGEDGYWVELSGMLAVGELDAAGEHLAATVPMALRAGVDRLRPGVAACEPATAMIGVAEDAGLGVGRSHGLGHGVGAGDDDPPLITAQASRPLTAGMVVVLHPNLVGGGVSATAGATYLVGERGAVALSRTPVGLRRVPV